MSQVFRVDENQIGDDASPQTIGTWNSLAHINLVVALEEEFGVQFQDQEIVQMTSLKEILSRLSPEVEV